MWSHNYSVPRWYHCSPTKYVLCHAMAGFCVISYIQISIGYYPCVHYFIWILPLSVLLLVPLLIMISQWEMTLLVHCELLPVCITTPIYDIAISLVNSLNLLIKHWNQHLINIVAWHKTRTGLWWSSVEVMFIVFDRDILTQKQFTWSPQLTCSCYKIMWCDTMGISHCFHLHSQWHIHVLHHCIL